MEQQERPGIDPPGGPPPRRFPRLLIPTTDRPHAHGRQIGRTLAIFGVIGLLIAGLAWIVSAARRSVDQAQPYTLSYRQVTLDPPPPQWIKGGTEGFLDAVLGRSDEFRSFSALNFDADHLRLFFQHNPWVVRVSGITRGYPNRVTMRLEYREPVAIDRLEDGLERTVVDHEGVILPRDEIVPATLERLVRLCQFELPVDPKPGETWNRIDPKPGLPVRNDRVLAAARLAAFLRDRLSTEPSGASTFPRFFIHAWGESELYLQVGPHLMFHWDEPLQGKAAEGLTPDAKWVFLRDFTREHPPRPDDSDSYWKFTTRGIEPDPRHHGPRQADQTSPRSAVRRTRGTNSTPWKRNPPG